MFRVGAKIRVGREQETRVYLSLGLRNIIGCSFKKTNKKNGNM